MRSDHVPVRSAGFSPQERPLADPGSCGLKSALLGRFMESVPFLADLLTDHEPGGAGVTTWRSNAKGERREGARGNAEFVAPLRLSPFALNDRFMGRARGG